jgi:hypothetical protein
MPSKNKKVIGVKVNEKDYQKIETYANTHNISISAMIKLYFDALETGEISIEKGELKIGVNPIDYAVSDDSDTPFGQKIEKKLDKLRERGYPDNFICSIKEQILNGLENQISMLPKKFDARRMKNEEYGC